jgi:predicted O-methyltransferase YrrM
MIARLLELEGKSWSVALRAAVLPVTCLLRRPERHLVWKLSEVCFGAQRPGVYPDVSLGALLHRDTVVRLVDIPPERYNVAEAELFAVAALASRLRAMVAFEFGTADGRTTRNLAANLPPSGRVYTLNLPLERDPTHHQDTPVGSRFLRTEEAERIIQLWGDSREFDFMPYAGRCQFVFIDADHAEGAVWSDSQAGLELVDRRRGVILWHDALRYGVQHALPRLARESRLPIHLITGTNLALLCFLEGRAIAPSAWAQDLVADV